ncbi:MAG: FeoA domain-containing protein [Myxococcota bacterium]
MGELRALASVAVGTRVVVRTVRCARDLRRRLLELGLLPGTEVEVIRRAPLGDPLELRLRGYALSIRREEAEAIDVELVSAAVVAAAREQPT